MSIIVLLISISITIALVFLGIFLWSLKSGQFDDTTTPAMRMIFDDRKKTHKPAEQKKTAEETGHSPADKNQSHS